tara:strand:- start:286 stop:513 length:228 start_codon:yes stop_codon:yes gene_type:complete
MGDKMDSFATVVIVASTIGGGYFGGKMANKYLESKFGPPPYTNDTAALTGGFAVATGAIAGFKISGNILLKAGMI